MHPTVIKYPQVTLCNKHIYHASISPLVITMTINSILITSLSYFYASCKNVTEVVSVLQEAPEKSHDCASHRTGLLKYNPLCTITTMKGISIDQHSCEYQ